MTKEICDECGQEKHEEEDTVRVNFNVPRHLYNQYRRYVVRNGWSASGELRRHMEACVNVNGHHDATNAKEVRDVATR